MHLSVVRWSCLGLLLAVISACSSDPPVGPTPPTPNPDGGSTTPDGDTPDPDAGGDGTGEDTCDEYARLECDRNRDCLPVFLDWNYGSHAACLTQAKQICQVWSSMPGSSVSVPRLVACLRAQTAAGCNAAGPFPECQSRPGELSNSAGCHLNDQCASGYCRREPTSGCGACADRLPEGAKCERGSECLTGRCSHFLCEPILKEGDVCIESSDCLRNLVCTGICEKVTLVGEGEACGWVIFCNPYLTCANGACVKDRIVESGQRCGTLDDGATGVCRNADCNTESNCVDRPPIGAACSPEGSCAGTGVCVQGQCRELAAEVCNAP
jgi:hypothetical protein